MLHWENLLFLSLCAIVRYFEKCSTKHGYSVKHSSIFQKCMNQVLPGGLLVLRIVNIIIDFYGGQNREATFHVLIVSKTSLGELLD